VAAGLAAGVHEGKPPPRSRLRSWFYGYTPPERGVIVLNQRRVYIVPTRMGWVYGVTVVVLLIGSINYALQLGFALTFLLAGTGIGGMVHTARNLARISIAAGRVEPVFAGEAAQFRLFLDNRSEHDRPSILARQLDSGNQIVTDVPAASTAEIVLAVPSSRRGWLPVSRIMLETRFPLGIFRAWSYIEPDLRAMIYPQPERSPLPPASADAQSGAARALAPGNDDFSGLRDYQPTDSPRHVAWKAVARSESMFTKQFAGESAAELRLDFDRMPPGMDTEARLSRLCGWVLEAEREGAVYGLRLPGAEIPPGRGEEHRAACLAALALHGIE